MDTKTHTHKLAWFKSLPKHPCLVFLILALFFGLFFIFKLAPLNGTDEFTHFPRVYQISDGTFWERKLPGDQYGGYLPTNVNNMINDYRNLSRVSSGSQYESAKQELHNKYGSISDVGSAKVQAIFTSVIFYPPWAYVPAVMGVLFAKLLHLPLIWYVYLGRIFSLLIWIGLTGLAIKIIPKGKWFMVALALLPTSLTQAATISSDGLLNSISWLLIALVLAILAKSIILTWKKLVALTILTIYLCVIKDGYWLIALFPLIIPQKYFSSSLVSRCWKSITLVLAVILSLLFALRTKRVVSGVVLTPTQGIYVNTQQQIHYLLHHIISFTIGALSMPFTKSFDTIYLGMFGIITNRLIYLSILVIGLLVYGLFLTLNQTNHSSVLIDYRKRLWGVAAFIIVGTYLLICVSFYLGESQVGGSVINSIYGRYFLPLFPLFLILPLTIKRRTNTTYIGQLLPLGASTIGLIATIMSLG